MRFRLTYEGPLLSSKPLKQDERDKRAAHKHFIRRAFHSQLKSFWETSEFLSTHLMDSASKSRCAGRSLGRRREPTGADG